MLRSLILAGGVGLAVVLIGMAVLRREPEPQTLPSVVLADTPRAVLTPARAPTRTAKATSPVVASRPATSQPIEGGLTALAGQSGLKEAGLEDPSVISKLITQSLGKEVDSAKATAVRDFVASRPYIGKAVTLTLADKRQVTGALINADAQTVQLLVGSELTTLKWNDIRAASAVAAMKIILAPLTGQKHLDIAQYLLAREEPQLFVKELEQALALDPALRPRAQELMLAWQQARDNRLSSGMMVPPVSPIQEGEQTGGLKPYPPPGTFDPASFIPAIDEEANQLARRSQIRFDRVLTDHFLLYHTWGTRNHDFLRLSLEGMYEAVVRTFGVPGYQNLFAGRCPVYAVTDFNQFRSLCQIYGFATPPGVLGVTITKDDGSVRMIMYWSGDESHFMQTLVHEGTHAVLHRFRSPVQVDAWLNEGYAEYVAGTQLPQSGKFETARVYAALYARRGPGLGELFSTPHSPPGPYYPICLSLVEYLIQLDGQAFAALIAGIKDGKTTEQALMTAYRMNLTQLETHWREWAGSRGP